MVEEKEMIPLVAALLSAGLPLLADAVKAKGKEFIEEKLGVTLDTTTPEQVAVLKNKEMEHKEFLENVATDRYKIEVDDRKDARAMQSKALQQEDLFAKRFIYWFSLLWSIAACAYIYSITFNYVPPENIRVVDTVLGFLLGTAIASILNFFYGSSYKSRSKDETIDMLAKQNAS
jgi:hypothetical protein